MFPHPWRRSWFRGSKPQLVPRPRGPSRCAVGIGGAETDGSTALHDGKELRRAPLEIMGSPRSNQSRSSRWLWRRQEVSTVIQYVVEGTRRTDGGLRRG